MRPILFSPPMVEAILEGRKTMTRRVLKREKQYGPFSFDDPRVARYCPYGQPGNLLWVKEALVEWSGATYYKVDKARVGEGLSWGWQKPVLHGMYMPRWAARIFLKITNVRVERVQDISNADARREGLKYHGPEDGHHVPNIQGVFSVLWDKLNGKEHPWSSNPWVWVIEFKRVEARDAN